MADKTLTDRQKAFCEHYVRVLNRTKAARLAGYSEKNANVEGHQLMKHPGCMAYIKELQDEWKEKLGISTEKILRELSYIAFADMKQFCNWNDQGAFMLPSDQLKKRQTSAIAEVRNSVIDENGNGEVKIKLHSKEKALELLGKHLGIFNEKAEVDHKGKITVEILDRRTDAPKN